jgi:hypothetical protein
MNRGPKEQLVWDGMPSRPAGLINQASRSANSCFAALFNGARNGTIFKPGQNPVFGKAEAEWAWPDGWNELRALGLVEWTERERPCHPRFNEPPMIEIDWHVTDEGHKVREDDLKWFRELMNARDQDEAGSQ